MLFGSTMVAGAEEEVGLSVDKICLASKVVNLVPDEIGDTVSVAAREVYCFTTIFGGKTGDVVLHRWVHKGVVIRECKLTIGGINWRTYSSKYLYPGMEGEWQVQVIYNEAVIAEKKFLVKP
jgi:hypothetical protein